jgi:hypothetical protein
MEAWAGDTQNPSFAYDAARPDDVRALADVSERRVRRAASERVSGRSSR